MVPALPVLALQAACIASTERQMTGFIDDYGGATDAPLQGVEDVQWAKMFPVPKGAGDVYSEDGFATPRIAYRLHYHLSKRVRFAFRSYALVPLLGVMCEDHPARDSPGQRSLYRSTKIILQ